MKKSFILLLSLILTKTICSQHYSGIFYVDEKMKKAPYTFVWLEAGRFAVKQTEISVDDYLTFLKDVSRDSAQSYLTGLVPVKECILFPSLRTDKDFYSEEHPDIINWIDEEKLKSDNNYPPKTKVKGFDDGAFNPYSRPITGITYEQANAYAAWCTRKFNSKIFADEPLPYRAIKFRLPTPKEMEQILKMGIENCTYKDAALCKKNLEQLKKCTNEKGCALCNCDGKDTCKVNRDATKALGVGVYMTYAYNPSWVGLYNIQGNAAEMTSEKGIAKGGSYFHLAAETWPDAVQNYDKPEKWLGLRLVAEVVDGETWLPLVTSLMDKQSKSTIYIPGEGGDYILLRHSKDDEGVFIYKDSKNTQHYNSASKKLDEKNADDAKEVTEIFKKADRLGIEKMMSLNEEDIKNHKVNYTILEYSKGGKIYRVCWNTHTEYTAGTERAQLNEFIHKIHFWHD